jgi:hypothetical protein
LKATLRRSAQVEIWKNTPRTNPKKWRPTPPMTVSQDEALRDQIGR